MSRKARTAGTPAERERSFQDRRERFRLALDAQEPIPNEREPSRDDAGLRGSTSPRSRGAYRR